MNNSFDISHFHIKRTAKLVRGSELTLVYSSVVLILLV